MAGRPNDIELSLPKNSTAADVKFEYLKKTQESIKNTQMRLFFGGKELTESSFLAEYGIGDENVLQLHIRKN
jgi:hypothetical protein